MTNSCSQVGWVCIILLVAMPKWFIKSVEITGGFLPGLSLQFPRGLTCIIGPRGSGKSTLEEIGDARAKFAALPPAPAGEAPDHLLQLTNRYQASESDLRDLDDAVGSLCITFLSDNQK